MRHPVALILLSIFPLAASAQFPVNSPALIGPISSSGSSNAIILNPNQPTYDFDFGSLLFEPPAGNDQQTTLAVDSINGNDANAGTLYAPKLTLQQTVTNGSVLGLYRGSVFRDSLPLSTLGTTHGIVVQDVALGSVKPLPIISALDPVNNSGITSNGDGTYTYIWTPTETLDNGGYANVYMVEINTATEAITPIASRRRMVDSSNVSGTPGSVLVSALSGGRWQARFHPSDNHAPGSGSYRYEVVSRVQPANWGSFDANPGDGAMSGLELVGGNSGYGSLGGPPNFTGDRLVFVHASTHNAVTGGGSLQRSVFYESGDTVAPGPSIQLAWYAGSGTGLSWVTSRCLFYMNVGDRYANGLISHTGGGSTSFNRGDLSDCAFIGSRWSDGSLHGTAIDYVNVAAGTINRVYVQGIKDAFGTQMPLAAEVKNSVFRGVHRALVGENFHDNIVQSVNGGDPNDANNRNPITCGLQQSGASATNNLFWAHTDTVTGIAGDDQVSGISAGYTNCTCARNIFVLDPANTTTPPTYAGPALAGTVIDYNLVINLSKAGFNAPGPAGGYFSWAAYLAGYPAQDQHSMYLDLSADPRGLQAVFADPANGDFRWAQTNVGAQCAAYCKANNVGPATVTTHWPTVPTVDAAVVAISLLPPTITSPGAVTFTNGVYGEYKITTNLDGTPGAPASYSTAGLPAWLSVNATSGVLSGTPPLGGSFSVTVSATNMAGVGSAVLGITVQTAFTAWQNAYFTAADLNNLATSGPYATPAGDGIPNLLKYALGLAPKSNGTSALPTISLTTVGNSKYLTLTYNQWLAASGVTYTVEVSGDLQTWSSGAGYTATVSATSNAASTMQTVVQRDLTPTSSAGRRFIRLRVSQP